MLGKDNTFMKDFVTVLNNSKMIVASIAFIVTSVVGGYKIFVENIVTVAVAEEMVTKAVTDMDVKIRALKAQTDATNKMVIEMQLIRLETKMYNKQQLTPTEKRVYDKLKKKYTEQ